MTRTIRDVKLSDSHERKELASVLFGGVVKEGKPERIVGGALPSVLKPRPAHSWTSKPSIHFSHLLLYSNEPHSRFSAAASSYSHPPFVESKLTITFGGALVPGLPPRLSNGSRVSRFDEQDV